MLKTELISEVQKDEYKNICKKLLPTLWKDLYQELCLTILEMPEDRANNIRSARYFIIGTICNMAQSSTSPFYFKYRTTYPIGELAQEESNDEYEEYLNNFESIVNHVKKSYFDRGLLLDKYIEFGSRRKAIQGLKDEGIVITEGKWRGNINEIKKKIRQGMNPIKVLLITTKENTGLKYHRQIIPHQRLSVTNPEFKFTNHTSQQIEGKIHEASIDQLPDDLLKTFDIVYFLRQISFARGKVEQTIDRCHSLGVKVILDIDDYWVLNKDHFMYDKYRLLDVPGETEKAIRLVDHVITTTEYFAAKIRPLNPNVTVLPNCISPDDKQFVSKPRHSDLVRIGWIGGVYHRSDIAAIEDTFCRMAKDKTLRNKYQVCLGGYNVVNTQRGPRPNQEYAMIEESMTCDYEFRSYDKPYFNYLSEYTPLMDHFSFFKSYRRLWGRDVYNYGQLYNEIDIAIAPLLPNEFNRCKSELKVIEAGWMGKTVVASDIETYNGVIEDGENGILINPNRNNIDWYVVLKDLILEKEYRDELAHNLNEDIHTHYNLDRHNQRRAELYKELCSVSV